MGPAFPRCFSAASDAMERHSAQETEVHFRRLSFFLSFSKAALDLLHSSRKKYFFPCNCSQKVAYCIIIYSPPSPIVPGNPLPRVLWYLDDEVIDDQFQQTYDGTIKNGLTIRKLTRKHTAGRLRCLATNNNITRPAETSLRLKMLCKFHLNL